MYLDLFREEGVEEWGFCPRPSKRVDVGMGAMIGRQVGHSTTCVYGEDLVVVAGQARVRRLSF